MNIQSAIREHILNHDFVMLPGIGAFIAEYTKPYLNEQGEIVPSVRNLRFNAELRNDSDVEILQEFKARMGISSEEVQDYYFSFLDEFDNSLAQKSQYNWENLGILFKDASGNLNFVEKRKVETISEPSYTSDIKEEPIVDEKVLDSIIQKIESTTLKVDGNGLKENLEGDFYFVPPKNKKENLIRLAIFVLPFLLLALALFYTVFYKPVNKTKATLADENVILPLEEPSLEVENEEVEEKDTIKSIEKNQVAVTEKSKAESKKEVVSETEIQEEHIVSIGIYRTEKHSDEVATFLAENGYPARVRKYGKLFKVYLIAKNSDQALQYVEEVGKIKGLGVKPLYQR